MIDIVFPSGNEEEFILVAKKLGYDSLCFVYDLKNFKKKKYNFNIKYCLLVNEKELNKAKKLTSLVFVKVKDNGRYLVESKKDLIIFGFEDDNKKDFIHQRRSGLNHIICKLAVKNKNKIGLSFNSLLNSDLVKREVLIGRVSANIKLCKKYKVEMVVGSFAKEPYEMRSYNDLKTFFSIL